MSTLILMNVFNCSFLFLISLNVFSYISSRFLAWGLHIIFSFHAFFFLGKAFVINDESITEKFLGDDGILYFIPDIALRLALSDLKVVVLS